MVSAATRNLFILVFSVLAITNKSVVSDDTFLDVLRSEDTKGSHPLLKRNAKNDLCSQHTKAYLQHVLGGSLWALQMLDSSTKIPESVLMGLLTHLGNFDECVNTVKVPPEVGQFKGQYCLASFMLSPKKSLVDTISARAKREVDFRNSSEVQVMMLVNTGLSMAYCIPSTCTAADFEEGLNNLLSRFPVSVSVPDNNCYSEHEVDLDAVDWFAVAFLVLVAVTLVSSTAYDLIVQENQRALFKAFSLYSNGKTLLNTESSKDSVDCLNGIRFFSICWVITGHRYAQDTYGVMNLLDVLKYIKDWTKYFILNGTVNVDTFLVLSGFLVSVPFLRRIRRHSTYSFKNHYLRRIFRLVPAYAVMILLEATLIRFVASGPLTKKVLHMTSSNCRENWWKNMLFINNYLKDNLCLGQSWYLGLDMQLFALSPLLLIPLWKLSAKCNAVILALLIAAGIISPFAISYDSGSSGNLILARFGENSNLQETFFSTHTRFGGWIIGFAAGYVHFKTENGQWKLLKLQVVLVWILILTALLGSLHGVYPFFQLDSTYSNFSMSLVISTFRSVWALGVGILILMCASGYGGPVNAFLSWKVFQPLSTLTYCAFLIHPSFQIPLLASRRTPAFLGPIIIHEAIADIFFSFTLAAILYLCIELPMTNISNLLFREERGYQQLGKIK